MDNDIRGVIEGALDHYLKPEILSREIRYFDEFAPILTSKRDGLFGYIMGKILGNFLTIMLIKYSRDPTTDEINELFEILYRRAEEVQEKIRVALMYE